MDMPVNVPIDNPNADTEWNDILRAHKIIPEKPPDPEPIIEEALVNAQERAFANRLEDKTLDELDELEDLEDDDFLASYRAQRLQELSDISHASTLYGQVFPIQKPDYARDVTEASAKCFVLVNLTSSSGVTNVESRILSELWRELAVKYGDVKFCEMRAELCIEGYPERNTPTILVYRDGDIKKQVVTLASLDGLRTKLANLERLLVEVGAVKENDVRVRKTDEDFDDESSNRRGFKQGGQGRKNDGDDDDDWD